MVNSVLYESIVPVQHGNAVSDFLSQRMRESPYTNSNKDAGTGLVFDSNINVCRARGNNFGLMNIINALLVPMLCVGMPIVTLCVTGRGSVPI